MGIATEIDLGRKDMEPGHTFTYRGKHRYLISMPTLRGRAVFTDNNAVLRFLGVLREVSWRWHFTTMAYTCLPDECILLVRGKEDYSEMKAFLRDLRATTSASFGQQAGDSVWSRKYRERVLRRGEDERDVIAEMFAMPVKRGLAASPKGYQFQGSFTGKRGSGRR